MKPDDYNLYSNKRLPRWKGRQPQSVASDLYRSLYMRLLALFATRSGFCGKMSGIECHWVIFVYDSIDIINIIIEASSRPCRTSAHHLNQESHEIGRRAAIHENRAQYDYL